MPQVNVKILNFSLSESAASGLVTMTLLLWSISLRTHAEDLALLRRLLAVLGVASEPLDFVSPGDS